MYTAPPLLSPPIQRARYYIRPEGAVFCYDCGRSVPATNCAKVGPTWDSAGAQVYATYHCGCRADSAAARLAEAGDHMARRHAWLKERGL